MYKSKVLASIVLFIYALFVFFLFKGDVVLAEKLGALISPTIALIYFLFVSKKTLPFSLFLIFYAVSDVMVLFQEQIPYLIVYFLGNSLYIAAYVSLLFEVCKTVCIFHVLKNFKVHVVVLTALNIYIAFVLQEIVDPFVSMSNEYFVELTYNIVMLLLLSVSLLNYFYKDNKKALYFFIGALCIVFAEVIGVAYLYIANKNLLHFLSTSLYLLAFYFFFQQSSLEHEIIDEIITDEA